MMDQLIRCVKEIVPSFPVYLPGGKVINVFEPVEWSSVAVPSPSPSHGGANLNAASDAAARGSGKKSKKSGGRSSKSAPGSPVAGRKSGTVSRDAGTGLGAAAVGSTPPAAQVTAVADIVVKLNKAKVMQSKNPSVVAGVFWNIAQTLWKTHADPRDAATALILLWQLLAQHLANPGANPLSIPITPAHLHAQCVLALARLCRYLGHSQAEWLPHLYAEALGGNTRAKLAATNGFPEVVARKEFWESINLPCSAPDAAELAAVVKDPGLRLALLAAWHFDVEVTERTKTMERLANIVEHAAKCDSDILAAQWARFALTEHPLDPNSVSEPSTINIARMNVIANGLLAAAKLGDLMSLKWFLREAEIFDLLEIEFLRWVTDHESVPELLALRAPPLYARLGHVLRAARLALRDIGTAAPESSALDTSAEVAGAQSMVVALVRAKAWDRAQVRRWEAMVSEQCRARAEFALALGPL